MSAFVIISIKYGQNIISVVLFSRGGKLIYFFFITYAIFLIIDYIYLYIFFDSKFFMNKSGSKLKYLLNKTNNKKKFIDTIKEIISINSLKYIIKLSVFVFVMVLLNVFIFNYIVFSKFLIINLGYKKLELVSAFDSYWPYFIKVYYISYVLFLIVVFKNISRMYAIKKQEKSKSDQEQANVDNVDKVYLGRDTNGEVYIDKKELYKNLLVTGSIGSGKTSGAINCFCKYMLDNNISGLIIDIKGNYINTINNFLNERDKYNIIEISENSNCCYNPLRRDIRSLEMANRLRKVIELISVSNSSDSYWLDKVENVLFNILILIKYTNHNLELKEIHRLVTDNEYLKSLLEEIKSMDVLNVKEEKNAHEINNVIMFFSKEYFNLDTRVLSIIKSEITRLTIPFVTEYDICNRFAVAHKDNIKLCFSLQKPTLIILSINMSKNFLLAKMLATFIKLDFQAQVLQNISNPIETFCICDEYQEFANTQDAHFLSLSREARCMNIFSMQSYSSLINALKNEQASKVIIANMVNKIWFRNDDNYTVDEIIKQIGQEKKLFRTTSISEGAEESKKGIFTGLKNKKSNISETVSYAENNDYIFKSKVITQELETFEALVMFGINEKMSEVKRVKFKGRYENE